MFSNARRVFKQCNTRLRCLYLLNKDLQVAKTEQGRLKALEKKTVVECLELSLSSFHEPAVIFSSSFIFSFSLRGKKLSRNVQKIL